MLAQTRDTDEQKLTDSPHFRRLKSVHLEHLFMNWIWGRGDERKRKVFLKSNLETHLNIPFLKWPDHPTSYQS